MLDLNELQDLILREMTRTGRAIRDRADPSVVHFFGKVDLHRLAQEIERSECVWVREEEYYSNVT